jgi:hypothetical protein
MFGFNKKLSFFDGKVELEKDSVAGTILNRFQANDFLGGCLLGKQALNSYRDKFSAQELDNIQQAFSVCTVGFYTLGGLLQKTSSMTPDEMRGYTAITKMAFDYCYAKRDLNSFVVLAGGLIYFFEATGQKPLAEHVKLLMQPFKAEVEKLMK